jgi:hypothetical protein
MSTQSTLALIQQIARTIASDDATITFAQPVQVFVGSTIQINNRLNTGYVVTTDPITVTDVLDSTTVVVTGLSEDDTSDFVVPDEEIGLNCYITNTYPQS